MRIWTLPIVAGSLLLASLPAFSQTDANRPVFTTISGPELQALLHGWGYRADLDVDDVGDPLIRSAAQGVDYSIYFYGCSTGEEHRRCSSLTLVVGFDLADGLPLSTVNSWNAGVRFGRAYLDGEADPWLQWDVVVADGVTAANLEQHIERWEDTLADFLVAIDW